ncbi:tubulin-specific chaperone D-like [Gigantopelta aegis]|uniref:tubulin-specific chaperone D-like n=1 Tax=Gigantopelta aegis TaxID=1735272 RepID=UPI001B889EA2|nr:tubulin-specific chaperone D-like [Gigantopelta aegis]
MSNMATSKSGDVEGNCTVEERGSHLQEFKEIEEIRKLIAALKNTCMNQLDREISCERFTYIIDSYQEQPYLIDPYLESVLNQLLEIVRDQNSPPILVHEAFKYLYFITKMRGFKVIVRFFPHEVSDVEPVLALMDKENPQDYASWETRYMLLLWLSIVCMIPFDLKRLDNTTALAIKQGARATVMNRILQVGEMYLTVNDKSRDAAAYLISRFMTRLDVKKEKLPEFIDWSLQILHEAEAETVAGMNALCGILMTLALLFKHGKREDLLTYVPAVLEKVLGGVFLSDFNTVLRKSAMKILQRLGLTLLKSRVTSWRYQRGNRSLSANLQQKKALVTGPIQTLEVQNDDEEFDVPDEVEDVIEHLLGGLRDKDTVVRWSAAKGIGRITGRLPKALGDEVVASVLELFSLQETDGAWHGGCLALAELGRRGLLLPHRLKDVVPVVLKSLVYDELRGTFSVGAHVRDAACYVCWAFARAYDPEEIVPYVKKLANGLLVVSVFDREVNVRRAASAAFQENVGRQGTFPHGIDILTTADYFAVGLRTSCYLELSVYIAQFEEYTKSMIDHLVHMKISHWDSSIRLLAAKGLHNLTPKDPEYLAQTVMPQLIAMTSSIDLYHRHGSILAAAEITHALFLIADSQKKKITNFLSDSTISGLKEIPQKLDDSKLFRGLGGELMRKAVSHLIEKMSLSKMPFHKDSSIDHWQKIIDDCLHHKEPDVQQAAINAIPAFLSEYSRDENGKADTVKQDDLLKKYLNELKSNMKTSRQGYSLALGSLPKFMLHGQLEKVLTGLIQAATISESYVSWAETRRDALKAITSIIRTVGVESDGSVQNVVCGQNVPAIYRVFLAAMSDYTMDSHGDVGAWVREASISGLETLTCILSEKAPNLITPETCKNLCCCLLQQACEKIDRTRARAGSVFIKLLYHKPTVPHVPHRRELCVKLPHEDVKEINWAAPSETFPQLTGLLSLSTFTYSVLLGLTVSVGGLTESLVKYSSSSLYNYLHEISEDSSAMDVFSQTLIQIYKDYHRNDRVSIPLLKMTAQLLSKGCFQCFVDDTSHSFLVELLNLVKKEMYRSSDPFKLMAAADVLTELLQFREETKRLSLSSLMILLCHKYPRVRKSTANKLYEALVTYDDIVPENELDNVMTILSDTNWDTSIDEVRPIRNKVCDIIGIVRPVPSKLTVTDKQN